MYQAGYACTTSRPPPRWELIACLSQLGHTQLSLRPPRYSRPYSSVSLKGEWRRSTDKAGWIRMHYSSHTTSLGADRLPEPGWPQPAPTSSTSLFVTSHRSAPSKCD